MDRETFLTSDMKKEQDDLIQAIRPELNYLCSNPIRACILHSLIKSQNLNYTLSVEELAQCTGRRHSLIIHHLEILNRFSLVAVVKSKKYGNKEKRSLWGLNLEYQDLISTTYRHIQKFFFTQSQLDKMSSVNKNVRSSKVI